MLNNGSLMFDHVAVTGNTMATNAGDYWQGGGGIYNGSGATLTLGDAQVGPLADNGGPTWTHALLAGSPAVDAGDDAACPATDQRGVARSQGAHCDVISACSS